MSEFLKELRHLTCRLIGDLELLQESLNIVAAKQQPNTQPKRQRRPYSRLYPFMAMQIGEEVFLPNKTPRSCSGALAYARRELDASFVARTFVRDGTLGALIARTG